MFKNINISQFSCDGGVASRDVSLRVYFLGTRAISPTAYRLWCKLYIDIRNTLYNESESVSVVLRTA